MRKRRIVGLACVIAFCSAAAIVLASEDMSAYERVTRIEAEEALPHLAEELKNWSPAVNATLFNYAGDEELTLAAQLALVSFPEKAEKVLGLYGTTPEFKQILMEYGPQIIAPIHYFIANESISLSLRDMASGMFSGDENGDQLSSEEPNSTNSEEPVEDEGLTAAKRGWYAVGFIRDEGHYFLGQFVTDNDGTTSWVQSERLFTGTKQLLTSGITSLESKWQRDVELGTSDYGWAAVDVLSPIPVFAAAKAAKAGKAARAVKAGKITPPTATTTNTGRPLANVGGVALRLAADPASDAAYSAAAIYALTHPTMLNSIGRGIAYAIGIPPWIAQLAIWSVVLMPLFIAVTTIYTWILRPITTALAFVVSALAWVHGKLNTQITLGQSTDEPTSR